MPYAAITPEEIIFYAIVWVTSFAASVARCIRDDEYRDSFHGIALGATSGFFSVGCVGIVRDTFGSNIGGNWYFIGVSLLIGLLAKEQDKLARMALSKVFGFIGSFDFRSNDDKKDGE